MLSLNVKSKYAIAIMVDLAAQNTDTPVQLKTLADRHKIPFSYLEHIVPELRKAGLLSSVRGAHGGYMLSKSPKDISVANILTALEGPIDLCQGHKGCKALHHFWKELEWSFANVLDIRLDQILLDQQKQKKVLTYTI